LAVEFRFVGDGFGFGGADDLVFVVGWRINSVEVESFGSGGVDNVVLGTSRNYDCKAVGNRIFIVVDNDFACTRFKTEKLIIVWMHFHTNFFAGLKSHEDKLAMLSGVQNFAEIGVFQGGGFDVRTKTFHTSYIITNVKFAKLLFD
jgi:hypothetical protein